LINARQRRPAAAMLKGWRAFALFASFASESQRAAARRENPGGESVFSGLGVILAGNSEKVKKCCLKA